LPERLLKPFYRHRKADFVTIAKTIGNCLGNSENLYRNAFYGVGFDTFVEQAFSEAHYANRSAVRLRSPILATYGKPRVSRQLISQAVEREGRDEADNGFRNALGNLRQPMVGTELRIRKLIMNIIRAF